MYILFILINFVKISKMDKLELKVKDKLSEYTPVGKAFCEGKCDRKVIPTKEGMVIVCDGCKRVVIDNRD